MLLTVSEAYRKMKRLNQVYLIRLGLVFGNMQFLQEVFNNTKNILD